MATLSCLQIQATVRVTTVRSLTATVLTLRVVCCVLCAVLFAVVWMDSGSQWVGTANVKISIASEYCKGIGPCLQRPPHSPQLLSLPFSLPLSCFRRHREKQCCVVPSDDLDAYWHSSQLLVGNLQW